MEIKKFLDEEGLIYLWKKLSLQDYPNNDTLIAVINAIDENKADKTTTEALQQAINILNGKDKGSVQDTVINAIATIVANAPEDFDTLKEIADWITNDEIGTIDLIKRVEELEGKIENKTEIPETNDSYQMLVTDSEGNTKWEERTHYVEPIKGIVLEEMTIPINSSSGWGFITSPFSGNISVGSTYTVTYNGVNYECVASTAVYSGMTLIGLGNLSVFGGIATNDPFVIGCVPDEMVSAFGAYATVIPLDGSTTATVSISGTSEIIHQLDEKYVPMINSYLRNGSALGSLRVVTTRQEDDEYQLGFGAFAEGDMTEASGYASHAEGYHTIASGNDSHAEGSSTTASGFQSHAEGNGTTASGDYAHAEGSNTTASGVSSHAEGYHTTASSVHSHAEGSNTTASDWGSHAEGDGTTASGNYSHAEGNDTTALGIGSHAEGGSSISVPDNISPESTLEEILAERKEKKFTLAFGKYSHAEGSNTLAFGKYSHAEGDETIASGDRSHAEGYNTTVSGNGSHAEGSLSKAEGNDSHAEGYNTTAKGNGSHAEGYNTIAEGNYSHAECVNTTASGFYSHAEGSGTTASGSSSHAEGHTAIASGDNSHAEGSNTAASGYSSHAEGSSTTASGYDSHAEGTGTTAEGDYSHAEGYTTTASGESSHAESIGTIASGDYSHAEGYYTTASSKASHAEGYDTIASGDYSHAEGYNTTAKGDYSHVQGKYNLEDTNNLYAHIVGNGSTTLDRSNAHTLDWNGNAWFQGNVYVGSTSGINKDEGSKKLATEEYVDTKEFDSIILKSENKKFRLTINDEGILSATEIV